MSFLYADKVVKIRDGIWSEPRPEKDRVIHKTEIPGNSNQKPVPKQAFICKYLMIIAIIIILKIYSVVDTTLSVKGVSPKIYNQKGFFSNICTFRAMSEKWEISKSLV